MKKFAKKMLIFIPIILLIIFINYYFDPANLFNNRYEEGIAKILISDQNVENITNYDERLVQKFYISNLKTSKDIVIIGSSRAMQINAKILNNDNIFNSCVSGATLEDYIAIYQIYRENNLLPKTIILGIDPWVFNFDDSSDRWKSISKYYYDLNSQLGYDKIIQTKNYDKIQQLLSLKYFQSSVKSIFKPIKDYYPTENVKSINNIKLSDGSLIYGQEYREASINEVENKVNFYITVKLNDSKNYFEDIQEERVNQFEKFINIIESDNVNVIFFLAPYYPKAYDYMINSNHYKLVSDVEIYLTEFAHNNDINIIGSYNPSNKNLRYTLNNLDFYDGFHPKREAVETILNSYSELLKQ